MKTTEGVRNLSKYFTNPIQTPPPSVVVDTPKGPRIKKLTVEEKLRKECWSLHYGSTVKVALCMFCGIRELDVRVASGWTAAHIVPETHCKDLASPYNLVPSCINCNNVMYQQNALDYLWDNFRVDSLKQLCLNVYTAFTQRNADYEQCIWKLIQHLFGHDEHQLGGGITAANEEAIYRILMIYQTKLLETEISNLMSNVKEKSGQLESLVKDIYRPSKRVRHFA